MVTDWSKVDPGGYTDPYIIRDPNGNPYGISRYVNNEMTNPRAFRSIQQGNYNWSDDFVGNIFAELKFLDHFTFKSSLNGKKSYWGSRTFTPKYYLSPSYRSTSFNTLNKVDENKFEWSMENTLTYQNKFGDHNLSILIGQGVYRYNISGGASLTYSNLPIDSWQDASLTLIFLRMILLQKDGTESKPVRHLILVGSFMTMPTNIYLQGLFVETVLQNLLPVNIGEPSLPCL